MVLGLALIASSWLNHFNATQLVDDLTRGQAEGFARDIREVSRPEQGPPRSAQLELSLASGKAWGLRYVAVLNPHGGLISEAGESALPTSLPLPKPEQLQHAGQRVRWLVPPPPMPGLPLRSLGAPAGLARPFPPGPFPPGPSERGPRGPFEMGPGGPPPPPVGSAYHDGPPHGHSLLIEFEPLPALALIERSERTVLLNVIAAIVLMVVAVFLWRLYARAQEAESHLARQKHLAVLGEMSAVLAHEIRNPLTAVKGHAQLIAERVRDDELQNRWATLMVDHVMRLERLVNQLLDFSRTREVLRKPVCPATLLDEAGCELDRDRIDLDVTSAPATWDLDPERMNQVFVNVLQNALQASPKSQQVDAVVSEEKGQLVVIVRDRGDGIPPEEVHRIFEPFHTKRVRGTGLGLTVAKRIVELHGGDIEASNHPEGGAVFRITLPKG
jgi:two-component system, NtrC family, sensor histidine kinase HydH